MNGKPNNPDKVFKNRLVFLGIIIIMIFFYYFIKNHNSSNYNSTNTLKTDTISASNFVDVQKYQDSIKLSYKEIDSIIERFGGYNKLVVKESPNKCNLFISEFVLPEKITDSITLCKLSNRYATHIQKSYIDKDNCNWSVMSIVRIYMNKKDLLNKENVVYSEVVPSSPDGDASINSRVLSKYK